MFNDDLKYWLALSFIKDVGPVTIKRLLSAFHSPERILNASLKELNEIDDIAEARAKKICSFNSWDKIEQEINLIKQHNLRVIKYTDREYPESLRQIDDSPVILYLKGNLVEQDKYSVAMVGSRMMTEYGKMIAERLSFELASMGITIVSGMARGIDTVSHRGALKAGGRSIAVLGCGLDNPYPPENKELFEMLSSSGCVISEFPIGTPPNKEHFPKRNRLISGLSLGVLVVEATNNSGSLITAGYALEQGKDVFAVPGNITSKCSEGTNILIKRGAKLVARVEDIIEELSPKLKGLLQENTAKTGIQDKLEINDEEKALCNILSHDPKHIDLIARETQMPQSKLLGLLLSLEIRGIVRQTEGKRFYLSY